MRLDSRLRRSICGGRSESRSRFEAKRSEARMVTLQLTEKISSRIFALISRVVDCEIRAQRISEKCALVEDYLCDLLFSDACRDVQEMPMNAAISASPYPEESIS